mgnify:CR=1 FL=1
MKIIRQKKDLNRLFSKINSFSFVPTMGGLHKGHEFLIKKARKKNKPLAIIAKNLIGFGVYFMEKNNDCHHGRLTKKIFQESIKNL